MFAKTKSTMLIALVMFAVVGFAPRAGAQATDGNIVGTITDATQAVIPGAAVTATNKATGVVYKGMSNEVGDYRINNVPVGTYDVDVTGGGMAPRKLTNVLVELNRTTPVNITLQVAAVSADVVVQEAPPLLDSSTSQLESTFKGETALNQVSAGNFVNDTGVLNLSLLAPGVTQSGGMGYGTGPAVGGQRPTNNSFNIDGVDNNRHDVTGPTVTVPNDAVDQFSLLENQFSPEFGGASGGVFNTVVKTGGNQIHGSVYEYFNNRKLNALDSRQALQGFTSTPRFDANRFGGTVGGPIIKNKLFYFGDYEYYPLGQASVPGSPILAPTAAGYSTIASLPGISKTNLGILQQYLAPAPTASQTITIAGRAIPVGTVPVSGPSYVNKQNLVAAGDWDARTSDKVRVRYIYNKYTGIDTNAALPVFYTPIPDNRHLFSLSEFHTFSPTALNEFRVSYSRKNNNYPVGDFKFPGLDQFPNLTFDDLNLQVGPDSSTPQGYIQGQLTGTDNFTKTFGRHTVKAGYQFMDIIASNSFVQRSRGDYDYSTLDFYLRDLSPDSLGERSVGVQGGIPAGYLFHSLYVNDDFNVKPNLTLNLGLRYEYMTVPVLTRYQQFSSAADVPGVITFREPTPQKKNFAPKVGFAWSPGKTSNWVVRGGFSLNYDLTYNNLNINAKPAYFQQTEDVDLNNQTQNFLAQGGLKPSNAIVISTDPKVARAAVSSYLPNEQIRPYSVNYTLGVQRSFGGDYVVEARYLGTKGVHLFVQDQINRFSPLTPSFSIPTFFTTPTAADLAGLTTTLGDIKAAQNAVTGGFASNSYARYGFGSTITAYMPEGNSKYNGLALHLTKRYSHNYAYTAAFTWSHALDDSTATVFSEVLTPRRGQDFRNLRNDWASSALDRRLRFTFAPSYDFKPFANEGWLMKNVVGNWNITGAYTFQSPEYATVQSGIDSNLNNDTAGDRAVINVNGQAFVSSGVNPINKAGQIVATGNAAIVAYVAKDSTARYVQAGSGAFPNSGRNTLPLRRIDNVDLQLLKRFNFSESTRFEIAGQASNLFNHPQWTGDLLNDVYPNQYNNTRSFLLTSPNASLNGNPEFGRFDHFYTSNPRSLTITARVVF
jgi:hypothetical protein